MQIGFAGGEFDKQLRGSQKQLDKIKQEIDQLRNQITKTNIKASSTLEQIKVIDHELSLLNRSKHLLVTHNVRYDEFVSSVALNLYLRKSSEARFKPGKSKLWCLRSKVYKRSVFP